MLELWSLVKRHMLRFLRDKTAVFFSFLSVIILLVLYMLFIGQSFTNFGSYNGVPIINENAGDNYEQVKTFLVIGVMMGGVLVINTMSLSLGMMGNIIEDLDKHSLDSFLVTPVKRSKIIISYYLAANIVTSVLSLFMWILTFLYAGVFNGTWFTFDVFLKVSGLLVFYTFISTSIMIYITTLLKSVNAFGTLSGILGTLVGFISGIYMPLNILPAAVVKFSSVVPFTHMAILLKTVLLEQPMEELLPYLSDTVFLDGIKESYGMNQVGLFGMDVPMYVLFIGIILFSIFMLFLAFKNMTKKMYK